MKQQSPVLGFTVLELLMALAILGFGIGALISLKISMQEQQASQLARAEAIRLEGNALTLLRMINPAIERTGTRPLEGNVNLTWQADLAGPVAPQLTWAGRTTEERVAVFKVDYQLRRDSKILAANSIENIGRFGSTKDNLSSINPRN